MAEDFVELLKADSRYKLGAYEFVMEALNYAQNELSMDSASKPQSGLWDDDDEPPVEAVRHVSGRQLCFAIRDYAISQYGLLARSVLQSWGVTTTDDFGQIVFNLMKCEKLLASENDRIEDFHAVYDFQTVFEDEFAFE